MFVLFSPTPLIDPTKPSKSEYFTLKAEVLSEVSNKLVPDDILLKAGPCTVILYLPIVLHVQHSI